MLVNDIDSPVMIFMLHFTRVTLTEVLEKGLWLNSSLAGQLLLNFTLQILTLLPTLNSNYHMLFTGSLFLAMDTFFGLYFHFCLEPALENWAKAFLMPSLRVHDPNQTHSLASFQWSRLSDQCTWQLPWLAREKTWSAVTGPFLALLAQTSSGTNPLAL